MLGLQTARCIVRKTVFSLMWHLLQQDYKASHFRLLQFTQGLLLVFLITLTLASESVQKHLAHNMANLLGADVVISQYGQMPVNDVTQLENLSSALTFTQSIKTTLTHNGNWQQLTLKAVDSRYPLQGTLQVSDTLETPPYATGQTPTVGEIWVGPRLAASLGVRVGQTITIADNHFSISRILHHEPDRLMEGHNVDMRAILHRDDFAKLKFNDDTVQYRYLLEATPSQINEIIAFQKARLISADLRHRHGAHPLALFWQRTENFLGLSFILILFMAAIAIYQISRVQIKKEQYFTAVCLSLGASRLQGLAVSIGKWLLHVAVLIPAVLLVSTLCHWAIIHWLSKTLPSLQWQLSIAPGLIAFIHCAMLLALFQLPVWFSIKKANVKQLIFANGSKQKHAFTFICFAVALAMVVFVYSDNSILTTMLLGAMICCVALIALLSWLSLTLGEKLTRRYSGLLAFATFMMKQRLVSKSTQIMGVGLCTFLLLFTLMLLRDVGNTMQSYNRQFDGNIVISQASSAQMDSVIQWADTHHAQIRQQKAFMYAKLSRINDQPVDDFVTTPSESLSTFQHAIRLHWTDGLPKNNRVVEGQWWDTQPAQWQQVSVEHEVMTDLGLSVGDQLTFVIANTAINFRIVASHEYVPGAGTMTFWVQMPYNAAQQVEAPRYHMASLEAGSGALLALGELWQKHPSLRMVSLQEMTKHFDDTLSMITQVIGGFALIILGLACIVIMSSVLTYEQSERKKNSLIISFGLPRRLCLSINLIEWALTGAIAATGAVFGTWVAGTLIYQSQFSMTYRPSIVWTTLALSAMIMFVIAVGYLASKRTLSSSVRELLTE